MNDSFNNHHHWVRPPLEPRSAQDTRLPLYERLGTVEQCYVKPGYSGELVSEVMESFLKTVRSAEIHTACFLLEKFRCNLTS